jgi:hypothetical protein
LCSFDKGKRNFPCGNISPFEISVLGQLGSGDNWAVAQFGSEKLGSDNWAVNANFWVEIF